MQIRISTVADIGKAIHAKRKRQRLRQDDLAAMIQSSRVFFTPA